MAPNCQEASLRPFSCTSALCSPPSSYPIVITEFSISLVQNKFNEINNFMDVKKGFYRFSLVKGQSSSNKFLGKNNISSIFPTSSGKPIKTWKVWNSSLDLMSPWYSET